MVKPFLYTGFQTIMRQFLFFILVLSGTCSYAQRLSITCLDRSKVEVIILTDSTKNALLKRNNGRQNNELRKKWTARTFLLPDDKIIVEFYDKQAVLIENIADFKKLEPIRFVKNDIWNLRKNISYKIELSIAQADSLIKTEKPERLSQFKSYDEEQFCYEVYTLSTGQVLFVDRSPYPEPTALYRDLKTLSSDQSSVEEQCYGNVDEEFLMKKLASGDALDDYEPREHLVYPHYVEDLVRNHRLTFLESNVYVSGDFYGNLYQSENGCYFLIDELNQASSSGDKLPVLTVRIYNTAEEVKRARKQYVKGKNGPIKYEHFYKKISDQYGAKFPEHVMALIDSLPVVLNFDKEQLSFDDMGIALIDEALKWQDDNNASFEAWFPGVLAYYGEYYIRNKKEGEWAAVFDKYYNVWIPRIVLPDKTYAFDVNDFYKDLSEWPIPLKWAGDYEGHVKKMKTRR